MYLHDNKGHIKVYRGTRNNADISSKSKRLELSLSVFVCVQVESRQKGGGGCWGECVSPFMREKGGIVDYVYTT